MTTTTSETSPQPTPPLSTAMASSAYSPTLRWLHWGMAALFVLLFAVAWLADALPKGGPERSTAMLIHKSLGVVALALVIARISTRITTTVPALESLMSVWMQRAAKAAHLALYGLMLALPVSGWAMSGAKGRDVTLFNLFTLPPLVSKNEALAHSLEEMHETLAMMLLILVGLHVLAALKHHLIDRDDTLRRMLPAHMR